MNSHARNIGHKCRKCGTCVWQAFAFGEEILDVYLLANYWQCVVLEAFGLLSLPNQGVTVSLLSHRLREVEVEHISLINIMA
jgi:hypothetical protein